MDFLTKSVWVKQWLLFVMCCAATRRWRAGLKEVIANPPKADRTLPEGYEVQNFAERVVRFILSTASRHHEWAGIRRLG